MSPDRPPSGLTRRRNRRSDEETGRRMLDAALDAVHRTGLTVSLEHLSFEDVIRDAGVSRSSVYRRWPHKDLFFADLLRELATAAAPAATPAAAEPPAALREVDRTIVDGAGTPLGRRALCADLLRRAARDDFDVLHRSPEWQTYLAVHATVLGLPDGELRADVLAALTAAERGFADRIAGAYRRIAELLGYRPRAGLADFTTLATLLGAAMRGLVLMAPSTPDIADRELRGDPFETGVTADWSQPALAVAGIAFTFLEPDPSVEWTPERVAAVRAALGR